MELLDCIMISLGATVGALLITSVRGALAHHQGKAIKFDWVDFLAIAILGTGAGCGLMYLIMSLGKFLEDVKPV